MYVFCRAMPDELAGSGGLPEIDVGFNALTAMPTSWVQGAKCGDGCPEYNISAAPIAYIGMDSNALAVRPSHVEFFFLSWCVETESTCNELLVPEALLSSTVLCVCVESKEVLSGSAINFCYDMQGSFPDSCHSLPTLQY